MWLLAHSHDLTNSIDCSHTCHSLALVSMCLHPLSPQWVGPRWVCLNLVNHGAGTSQQIALSVENMAHPLPLLVFHPHQLEKESHLKWSCTKFWSQFFRAIQREVEESHCLWKKERNGDGRKETMRKGQHKIGKKERERDLQLTREASKQKERQRKRERDRDRERQREKERFLVNEKGKQEKGKEKEQQRDLQSTRLTYTHISLNFSSLPDIKSWSSSSSLISSRDWY